MDAIQFTSGYYNEVLYRAPACGYNSPLRTPFVGFECQARLDGWELDNLISPHGSRLVESIASERRVSEIRELSRDWPSVDLDRHLLCDLELLLNGGYSPLEGFMGPSDHETVCSDMHLTDGTLWPLPITLGVSDDLGHSLSDLGGGFLNHRSAGALCQLGSGLYEGGERRLRPAADPAERAPLCPGERRRGLGIPPGIGRLRRRLPRCG